MINPFSIQKLSNIKMKSILFDDEEFNEIKG